MLARSAAASLLSAAVLPLLARAQGVIAQQNFQVTSNFVGNQRCVADPASSLPQWQFGAATTAACQPSGCGNEQWVPNTPIGTSSSVSCASSVPAAGPWTAVLVSYLFPYCSAATPAGTPPLYPPVPGVPLTGNPVTNYTVALTNACFWNGVNFTMYTCTATGVSVTAWQYSNCSGAVTSQQINSGCTSYPVGAPPGTPLTSSIFVTCPGPGLTLAQQQANAASVQAALIVPLVMGSLVLLVTAIVKFSRKSGGGSEQGVRLSGAGDNNRDARAMMQQQQAPPPPLPPKRGGR